MATYPGAVKTFSVKNTNDVIEASHVNDIQDEVTAIENALVGSARIAHDVTFVDATYDIGKSGATRPRDLFLSRNAVIAGNLTVAGTITGLAAAYPVGSIYMNADVSTNPATLLGFGTWAAFGTGRVLVGIDAGQTEFDTLGETGGAKTHTLSSAEMPAHTHTQDAHNHTQDAHNHTQNSHNHTQDAHNHTQDAHTHTVTDPGHTHVVAGRNAAPTAGAAGIYVTTNQADDGTGSDAVSNTTGITNQNATATNQATTATNQAATATNIAATATNQATTATNQNTGGGGAHNNLQPYIVVHMWKRTA